MHLYVVYLPWVCVSIVLFCAWARLAYFKCRGCCKACGCDLFHLTEKKNLPLIGQTGKLFTDGRAIFAIRVGTLARCRTKLELMICTTLFPPRRVEAIHPIEPSIRQYFDLVVPLGVYTSLKCIFGNYYAPYQELNFNQPDQRKFRLTALAIHAKMYLPDLAGLLLLFVNLLVWLLARRLFS
jgi:hypothetical protein